MAGAVMSSPWQTPTQPIMEKIEDLQFLKEGSDVDLASFALIHLWLIALIALVHAFRIKDWLFKAAGERITSVVRLLHQKDGASPEQFVSVGREGDGVGPAEGASKGQRYQTPAHRTHTHTHKKKRGKRKRSMSFFRRHVVDQNALQ